jgi:hypothetical protein
MSKYRKKPVVIEAVQLTWDTWNEICDFVGVGNQHEGFPHGFNPGDDPNVIGLKIPTLEGVMEVHQGDWIIKGVQGEFYPCKPDIFEATYDEVLAPDALKCAHPEHSMFNYCPYPPESEAVDAD